MPAMLRSKYLLANKGYARHEFKIFILNACQAATEIYEEMICNACIENAPTLTEVF